MSCSDFVRKLMINFSGMISQSWYWNYFFSHFGWVDWTLTAFIFLGVLLGLRNGLSKEIPRLIESLISLYVTLEYYSFFATWIARETPWPESYARIFTFLLAWLATTLVLRLLFEILGKLTHLEVASPFQWVGGFFVGGVRYLLFFSMFSYFLVLIPVDWIQQSYRVQSWSGQIVAQIPAKIHDGINGVIPQRKT